MVDICVQSYVLKTKNGTFVTTHFCVELSYAWFLGTCMYEFDLKGTQRGRLGT